MAKTTYKTHGVITSVDLMGKSFTIDPISPYVFEQRNGDRSEKFILFVSGEDGKDSRNASIQTCNRAFEIPKDKDVDLAVIIALKSGREKIELKVNSCTGKKPLKVEAIEIIKS